MPTRMASLAPRIFPDDFVPALAKPAPAAASERFKNDRRVTRDIDSASRPVAVTIRADLQRDYDAVRSLFLGFTPACTARDVISSLLEGPELFGRAESDILRKHPFLESLISSSGLFPLHFNRAGSRSVWITLLLENEILMRSSALMSSVLLCLTLAAVADGPQDNLPDSV